MTGSVFFDDKPASGAFLVLHPRGQAAPGEEKPSAQVEADGTFSVNSNRAAGETEGAPAGEYAVTVEWHKLVVQGRDAQAGPNVIPPVYSKPDSTPLKVTVTEGKNELKPFKITARK